MPCYFSQVNHLVEEELRKHIVVVCPLGGCNGTEVIRASSLCKSIRCKLYVVFFLLNAYCSLFPPKSCNLPINVELFKHFVLHF